MKYRLYPVVVKKVTLYETFFQETLKVAEDLGLSYQDYIRYLLTQDLRKSKEKSDIFIRESKARVMLKIIQNIKITFKINNF